MFVRTRYVQEELHMHYVQYFIHHEVVVA